jgi:phage shock protein PspC (stress-responsive transcriptional regulator)
MRRPSLPQRRKLIGGLLGYAYFGLQPWLIALLVAALALFTWRAYSSVTPFGWV